MTVYFQELAGSPEESAGKSGGQIRRQFVCAWADRLTVAALFTTTSPLGLPMVAAGFPAYYVNQVTIRPYSAEFDPDSQTITDPSTTTNAYTGKIALIEVTYAPDYYAAAWTRYGITQPSYRTGTTLKLKMRFSGQFLTIPGRCMIWDGANPPPTPPDLNARILIPQIEFHVEWDLVNPFTPATAMAAIGGVNNATFLDCPAETLLLEGVDVDDSLRVGLTNPFCVKANFVFKARLINVGGSTYGWNHEFRESPVGWTRVLMADGQPRYRLTSFSSLFA